MAVKEKAVSEEMEWSAEEEIQLYLAMVGLRPIGINKHIHMACICKRLSSALKRDIQPDTVWAHLHTMFNLEVLDQIEPLPLPQEHRDFSIPESEFSLLISKKLQEEERRSEEKSESRSKSTTPQPQSSSSNSNTKSNQPNIPKSNQPSGSKPSSAASKHSQSSKPSPALAKSLFSNVVASDTPKRGPGKRTRGSISNESNSPSTTPPPTHTKRRRI